VVFIWWQFGKPCRVSVRIGCPRWDSNRQPPKYETRALSLLQPVYTHVDVGSEGGNNRVGLVHNDKYLSRGANQGPCETRGCSHHAFAVIPTGLGCFIIRHIYISKAHTALIARSSWVVGYTCTFPTSRQTWLGGRTRPCEIISSPSALQSSIRHVIPCVGNLPYFATDMTWWQDAPLWNHLKSICSTNQHTSRHPLCRQPALLRYKHDLVAGRAPVESSQVHLLYKPAHVTSSPV
jgi:hypothetical protein